MMNDINCESVFTCNSILNKIPGYVLILDDNLLVKRCNNNYLKLSGFSRHKDILNKKYIDFPNTIISQRHIIYSYYDNLTMNQKKQLEFIFYNSFISGEPRTYYGINSPILNDNGVVSGVNRYIIDISEQLVASSKLILSRDKIHLNPDNEIVSLIDPSPPNDNELTPREIEVIFYLLRGFACTGIAENMGISPRTVETHVNNIKVKLKVKTKQQLIYKSLKLGYLFKSRRFNMNGINLSPDNSFELV